MNSYNVIDEISAAIFLYRTRSDYFYDGHQLIDVLERLMMPVWITNWGMAMRDWYYYE